MTETSSGGWDRKCSDCGELSPSTDTNYTLISAKFGWRLTFSKDLQGRRLAIWRCPKCWAKHNARPT